MQNQQTRELISAQKKSHKHSNKDWYANKYKIHKLHQRYILKKGCPPSGTYTFHYITGTLIDTGEYRHKSEPSLEDGSTYKDTNVHMITQNLNQPNTNYCCNIFELTLFYKHQQLDIA